MELFVEVAGNSFNKRKGSADRVGADAKLLVHVAEDGLNRLLYRL